MKLLTNQLLQRFKEVGRQEDAEDPIIICKLFNPVWPHTWYLTEYYPEDKAFYCFVTWFDYDEWGYSSLDELQSIKLPLWLSIERDIHFEECRFSEAVKSTSYSSPVSPAP